MRSVLSIGLALAFAVAGARGARADEPDPGPPAFGWSIGAGVATALVPLAVGGGLLAVSSDHTTKHASIDLIAAGWALAPLVSHLVAHEWKRAAIFSVAPLVFGALAVGLLEGSTDDLLDNGTPPPRVVFGAALALELMASSVGIIDSMMARERARARKPPPVTIVPSFGRNQIGLSLGGAL